MIQHILTEFFGPDLWRPAMVMVAIWGMIWTALIAVIIGERVTRR